MLEEIIKVNEVVRVKLKEKLEDFDLSIGQWNILMEIYKSDTNKISANKIEEQLNINRRVLSISLKRLEELKYIQREGMRKDKRKKFIILTDLALERAADLLLIEEELNISLNSLVDDNASFIANLKNITKI